MTTEDPPQPVRRSTPAQYLDPVVLGLGAAYGYSGDDLTNPRTAVLTGEVPYLRVGDLSRRRRPLELRVHGVGGAPPADNLGCPDTVQVAGDATAGFYRPWFPGGRRHDAEIRREAYCWGKLNYRSATRAFWLLLVAFMIVNVAHFALPRSDARPAGRIGASACRALLRLLGLAITLAFIGTTITVLADLAAWQAPRRGALPSWLHWFGTLDTGPRLALALLITLAVLAGMAALSRTTAESYEAWDAGDFATADPRWPLTDPQFWCGERTVSRQRDCHVVAGCAEIVFVAAMPHSSALAVRAVLVTVAAVLVAVAAGLTLAPWTDRDRAARTARRSDVAVQWITRGAVGLAIAVAVSRFWWQPNDRAHALPGSQPLQTFVVFVIFGVLALVGVFLLLARPWRQADVMGNGFAALLLATLGSMIATIFGAAFTLTVANLLGTPRVTFCGRDCAGGRVLYLPSTVFAGGIGMIAALGLTVLFALFAFLVYRPRLVRRFSTGAGPGTVAADYPQPGGERSIHEVARTWAGSALADLAAPALAVVTVPTALAALVYQVWLAGTDEPGARWLQTLAAFGGTLGVLAIGYFLVQLRAALVAAQARKRFGFLWDVGTFFPRACAPFAPPCYAERAVPEIVTRIRRVVGDEIRHPDDPAAALQSAEQADRRLDDPREAHSGVLLVGYSQGTPISVAVLAQLPADIADRVALLTLAAPVRRLYGRTFPAYFGPSQLEVLRERLTGAEGAPRWRNLVRRSDYIGGWVVAPPGPGDAIDIEIHDPPVLWSDHDPSPPPTHRHSDWFHDPQTRPYADDLAAMVRG